MIGMIGHAERIIFCEGTCTRKHVVPELCAWIKVRAPRTGTNWPSINVCRWYNDFAVSPHSVVAIRSAWFNAPWFFLEVTTTVDWTRRTCCSAVLPYRCCDDIKHAQDRLFEHVLQKQASFNKTICVQLFVFNSDPYGRTPSPAHNS